MAPITASNPLGCSATPTLAAFQVSEADLQLLVAKYMNDDMPELVNYVAFANTVAPPDFEEEQHMASSCTIAAAH